MFIEALADYLESKDVGAVGSDLFAHDFPPSVKQGVLLKEPVTGIGFDHELPGFIKGRYEVIVRHFNHEDGLEFAMSVWDALNVKQPIKMGDVKVNYVRPLNLPAVFPVFESDQIEYSIVIDACFILKK